MVIQVDSEGSSKSAGQTQNMESKKYIVVKNHVREIQHKDIESSSDEHNSTNVENFKKPIKKHKHKKQQSSSSDDNNLSITEISKSDLKELKTVYKKCKAVLMNIESKYGHLLSLDDNEITNKGKRKHDRDEDDQCTCTLNRKIVFDDNGQEVYDEGHHLQNHICAKKLKNHTRPFPETYPNVQIENEISYDNLPETIQELTDLLKNPSIEFNLRQSIIGKIRDIRQDYLNMIRFERSTLIEKLKTNPEDIIDFKGTNISSLAGYPTK
ncbi:uncharacterized protein LOC126776515 [Nymphalis io]|uniref:uncharacterized protein LOC126776515 n=1 Tax=Inachis io TaxID=171585 RepID=UPI0021672AB1|nr:uncharacterized protein LOC126776515 [Nymphalis io]